MSPGTFSEVDPTPEQLRSELDLKKKTGRVNLETLAGASSIEREIINLLQDSIDQGNSLIDATTLTYRLSREHRYMLTLHAKLISKVTKKQDYNIAWTSGAVAVIVVLWEIYRTLFTHV